MSDYIVYLAVTAEEMAPLAHAAEWLEGEFQFAVVEGDQGHDREAELGFRVEASSPEEAMLQAERLYSASREHAGLPLSAEAPRMSTAFWAGST